jgi:hypothetical protein
VPRGAPIAALLAVLVTLALRAAPASAQPELPAIERPLALAPGACEGSLVVESNLSTRRRFEPVSLAPDLRCGVHPRLTVGVSHSARSLSLVDSGGGLCLRGAEAGCPHVYDATALDALAPIRGGAVAVAARLRLVASSYDPFKPSLRPGALIRLRRGPAALLLDPQLAIGLANRDRGNRDQLNVPLVGQLQIGWRALVELRTGVRGELVTFGDAFAVPVGAGVRLSPAPAVDIGLEVAFSKLLGPQNTVQQRHLALYVTYRLDDAWPGSAARSTVDGLR